VTSPERTTEGAEPGPGGWLFWIGLALGWAVMAYAVRGALMDSGGTNPDQLVRWVIGGALVHDLVVAPLVTGVALLLAWRAPSWWGKPLGVAAAFSAIVVLFSWPVLRGYGRHPGNSSTLPRNYTAGVAWVIGGVWVVTLVLIGFRALRRGRMDRGEPS